MNPLFVLLPLYCVCLPILTLVLYANNFRKLSVVVLVVALLAGMLSRSVVPGLEALILLAIVLGSWRLNAPWQRVAVSSTVGTLLAVAPLAVWFSDRHREISELKREYPFVSLRERLKGESRRYPSPAKTTEAMEAFEGELRGIRGRRSFEDLYRRQSSLDMLANAHDSIVLEFIESDGLGVGRIPRMPVTLESIELHDEPVPVCVPPAANEAPATPGGESDARPMTIAELTSFHGLGLDDFLNPIRFGWMRDVDHVLGFEPHAFKATPKMPSHGTVLWHLRRLQLVGLLKHETPVAYVSDNLPNMRELSAAETRPLDDFEAAAVQRLRDGEAIVTDRQPESLQMVGAIRATSECLQCHTHAVENDLLGAFTYLFVR